MSLITKHTSALLRIASKTRRVEEISNILNVEPTESFDKGDIISVRSPNPSFRKEALWLFDSNIPKTALLEEHINKLIDFIKSQTNELLKLKNDCDIELYCEYTSYNGQGGFVITHNIIRELAELPIDIVINVFLIDENAVG